jgi:hypothetical protein
MLAAHEIAWRTAGHHEAASAALYVEYAPVAAALAIAMIVVAALTQFVRAAAGLNTEAAPPPVVFAALPIVGFVVQEHVEHLVAGHELHVGTFVSAPFLLGLALQLPAAALALVVTRAILAFARRVATARGSHDPIFVFARSERVRAFVREAGRGERVIPRRGRAPPFSLLSRT